MCFRHGSRDTPTHWTHGVHAASAAFQVDSRVNAIATGYDDLGRVENVRSFSDHGDGGEAIVNGAAFARDQLWRVLSIAQEHDGAVTGNSTAVSYTYETAPINSGNIARQTALVYPDSWTLTTGYGALGSVDDRISRAASLFDQAASPVDYAAYSYIGLSTPAIVDYTIPDFKLTRFHADNGATNSGSYPGLDRYGRVARQIWVDDDFAVNSSSSAVPNKPPIVSTAYTYDNTSNRTGAFDARPKSSQPLSNMYSYDGLHRLIDARRGAWSGGLATPSVSQLKGSQNWALDPLGNWNSVGTDVDGASGIDSDETETRDHRDPSLAPPVNQVNELFKRELAAATGGGKVNLDYDFAGNLLRQGLQSGGALKYTHDAWNRLVKVEFEEDEAALHPRAEYEYNGVNWRTVTRADTNTTDATHELDEMRVMLYDASWRLLESRIDSDYDPESEAPDFEEFTQHVWGLRYIDDIVATRRDLDPAEDNGHEVKMFHATDAQCSSVAVLLDNGALLERIAYSVYGVARLQWPADASGDGAVNSVDLTIVLNAFGGITSASYKSEADFNRDGTVNSADLSQVLGFAAALPEGTLSSPGIANRTGYCGYRFAPETEMYLARNRWNSPPLGRWIERDPLGYVDGMGLYEYVRGRAIAVLDPSGLSTATGDRWWSEPDQFVSKPRYEPRNDPANGCGITVHRVGAPGKKNIGHDWIEIDDPALDRANGGPVPQGIGFWPKEGEGLFNAPSELFSPGAASTEECACTRENDEYTGSVPGQIWPVHVAARVQMKPRDSGVYEFWLTPAALPTGLPVTGASCNEIRDCVRHATVNRRYNLPTFNCRDAADHLLKQCGLTRYPGDRWTGDSQHQIIYPLRGPKY